MTRNILKYLFFITIILSSNSLFCQKIDSSRTSYPGVLFDNPYANQKFNGNWVIKGWDGNDKLFDSLLVKGLSIVDPSIDSSFYKSTYNSECTILPFSIGITHVFFFR